MATHTVVALPALVTGQNPTLDPPVASFHPDNLFTLLAPTHELEVFETATGLCPYTSCAPIVSGADAAALDEAGPHLDDLVDDTVDLWFDRVSLGPETTPEVDEFAEEVVEPVTTTTTPSAAGSDPPPAEEEVAPSVRAEAFRHSFDATKGPALYFLHLMLPHRPWVHREDGEAYDPHDRHLGDMPLGDQPVSLSWAPWVAAVSEQRHLLQAEYTDALIGQMLDTLRDEGLYDDSLIVITADHGIALGERTNSRYVEPPTVDGIAYAPLLVKEPGQDAGVVDDTNVTSIDVLPTIAERLGLTPDWDVDGLPAGSAGVRARRREAHLRHRWLLRPRAPGHPRLQRRR